MVNAVLNARKEQSCRCRVSSAGTNGEDQLQTSSAFATTIFVQSTISNTQQQSIRRATGPTSQASQMDNTRMHTGNRGAGSFPTTDSGRSKASAGSRAVVVQYLPDARHKLRCHRRLLSSFSLCGLFWFTAASTRAVSTSTTPGIAFPEHTRMDYF